MIEQANHKKRILLVDDDQSVTQMLRMLLETRGYDVMVANSGEEAFHCVATTTDIILLDLILPDQDGFEICRKLKEDPLTRHVPIIILSAKLLSSDIVEGLYLGADDYLTKPFEYEELVARMEAVMRRSAIFRNGQLSTKGEDAIICELRRIIDEEQVVSFYQPIFSLNPFKVYGLEALTRPKTQSMLANPELLFKAAIQFGMYHEMEILSWKRALEQAASFSGTVKIFLNCNPYLVEGAKFLTIKSLFQKNNIAVQDVVLEITERSAITDFKVFYEHLTRYRECGFQFAVDDVGGGYASLETIVTTKPEVVKIDRHIVSDVDKDPLKRSIVKFVVGLCKENNIFCIAEGIETKDELATIRELGVDAVQGYYLYKPTSYINLQEMQDVSKVI